MKLLYKLFPRDIKVSTFNRAWWFYIICSLLGVIVFTLCGNGLSTDGKFTLILITSIFELVFLRVYKLVLIHKRDDYFYFNDLPCYLCNQSTFLCIIAALTRNSHLMAFCIILGTGGSLLAFLFPDAMLANQPFYSFQTFGFYFYHALLIVTCLSFYTLGLYKPDLMDALWNMVMLFFLGTFDHILNLILIKSGINKNANYNFTMVPDNGFLKILYKYVPKQFYYMLLCIPIAGLLSLIVLLII